jgi:biopolymer transport protein ExbD
MAGGGGGESGEPEFQIAPMIDVLLVLLCFFVSITTAQVLKVDKNIVLPVSPNAKERDQAMAKHEVAVNVRWNPAEHHATVLVDDKEYAQLTDLIPYLKDRLKGDSLLRAVVRGDAKLPAIEIQKVMNVVGESGISDISFAASNR